MDFYLQLLLSSIPSLVIVGLLFLLVKRFIERDEKQRFFELKRGNQKEVLELRLQAYERLVLLLERSRMEALKARIYTREMKIELFVTAVKQNLHAEIEHNLTQQLYVSNNAWVVVRKTLMEQERLIMLTYSMLDKEKNDFFNTYNQLIIEEKHLSVGEAILLVKNEVKELF
ncbi:MAG: hypothetical protein ACI8ZO_000935 [Flavobacteriales bacterium]|jgi:hypothetical protein